jgi:cell wall-associated NlpC family hydrolase
MVRKRLASTALAVGLAVGVYLPLSGGMTDSAAATARSIGVGARGSQVVWIQQQLGVRTTGYYGNETRAAVAGFQRWFHMPATGVVNEPTALKMLQAAKIKAARRRPAGRRVVAAPRPAPASSLGQAAIRLAAAQRGKPYVYGATGPRAFDCSGLTQYVFSKLGRHLPRTTYQQYAVTKIPRSQIRPGDLVFTPDLGHVGIYAGYGSMWNAPHTGAVVRLQRVWYSGYLVGRVR